MASMILHRMMVALFALAIVPAAAQAQEIKVTLLGTGCPPAVMNRFLAPMPAVFPDFPAPSGGPIKQHWCS